MMWPILRTFTVVALAIVSLAADAFAAQRIHTVVSGQTLGGLARRYQISVAELREANNLAPQAVLKVGQRLLVPERGEMERLRRLRAEQAKQKKAVDDQPPADMNAQTPADGGETDSSLTEELDAGSPRAAEAAAPISSSAPAETPSPRAAPSPPAPPAKAKNTRERKTHVVASGHTLGKIARRYQIEIESLCRANGLDRRAPIKVGQTLIIPNGDDDPLVEAGPERRTGGEKTSDPSGMRTMTVGASSSVYYYPPTGPNRFGMRPVLVYLHGRGGDPVADCRRWAPIARRFGWLVCPSGPVAHNGGRAWNNSWPAGHGLVMASIQALRHEYGRRVQLYGNTLIGFSEGAYVAMNVGVREPRTFNRWLILGADVSYWGGAGVEALKDARSRVRRVALITGGRDMVVDDTRTVAGWLEKAKVPIRVQTPDTLAHEVALERMPGLYESALRWLDQGTVERSRSTTR